MISIIVPVFNTGKKLERCVESLLNQTYKNIEILIIDDGSTDEETIELCNKFKKADIRIKVITKQNGGVSSTRNIGIKEANGKYLMFVDSDDYVENTICLELHKVLQNTNSKTSLCGFSRDFYKDNKPLKINNIGPDCRSIMDEGDFKKEFGQLYEKTLLVSVWAKLYDMNIIKENNIKFNESISLGEDMLFNFDYFRVTNQIAITNKFLYHYICDEGNSLTSRTDFEKFNTTKLLLQTSLQFVEECGINNSAESIIAKIYLRGCFRSIESIFSVECHLSKKEKYQYISSIKNDRCTKNTLEIKANDREHKIYKFVLTLNRSLLIKIFAYLRLIFKQRVRGS